jgi:hypothetical protein
MNATPPKIVYTKRSLRRWRNIQYTASDICVNRASKSTFLNYIFLLPRHI